MSPENTAAMTEDPPKNGTMPRVRDVGSFLRQFNSIGRVYGDPAEFIGVYNPKVITHARRKQMMDDPIIAFGMAIHRGAITNMPYAVESKDPEIRAFVQQVLDDVADDFFLGISMAIPFGWKLVELVWAVKDFTVQVENRGTEGTAAEDKVFKNAWVIERAKSIDNDTLQLIVDPKLDQWAGVTQNFTGEIKPEEIVRPPNVVLWSHRAQEVDGKLTGRPMLNQCYTPWWKGEAYDYLMNRYFEFHADPSIVGRAPNEVTGPDGKPMDGGKWILDQAATIRSGGAVALSSKRDPQSGEYLFDLSYLTAESRSEDFQKAIDAQETRKLRGALITDRVMASGAGGLGTGDADFQADVLAEFLNGNIRHFLGSILNPQVVKPSVVANFGEERWQQSRTKVVAGGVTGSQRDIYKDIFKGVIQSEQASIDGRPGKVTERLDMDGMAKALKLPLKSSDEIAAERKKAEPKPEDLGTIPDPNLSPEEAEAARKEMERRGVLPLPGSEPPAPVGTQAVEVTEDAVLNGAQVKAATDIVIAVAGGEIPRDSGIGQLIVLFNLTPEQAEQIMGSAGTDTPTTPNPNPKAEAEAEAKRQADEAKLKAMQQGGEGGGAPPAAPPPPSE